MRLWFAFLCGAALACLSLLLVPPAGATSVPAVSPSTSALAHSTAVLKSALTAADRHTNDAHTALDNTPGAPALREELWRDRAALGRGAARGRRDGPRDRARGEAGV